MASLLLVESLLGIIALVVSGLDNGVGRLPPLGYNTWNDVGCSGISEASVMAVADALEKTGLKARGYQYINLDDCWQDQHGRDAVTGRLRPDPQRFPSGLRNLSDALHARGFLFGIYTDRGTKTCAGRPGSLNSEELDAQTFAEWAVDYVKEDNCYSSTGPNDRDTLFKQFQTFRDALNRTGRPMFFSVCGGGDQLPFSNLSFYATDLRGGAALANSWRISSDCIEWQTCQNAFRVAAGLGSKAGPGGFNDPDMLLGSSGSVMTLTQARSRTQFSIWAILMAPLLIGAHPARLSAFDLETYSNAEVIAVNQDPLGRQGFILSETGPKVVWGRLLADSSWALVFQNNGLLRPVEVVCDTGCWAKMPFNSGMGLQVRDLWLRGPAQQALATVGEPYAVQVPRASASVMLRFMPVAAEVVTVV